MPSRLIPERFVLIIQGKLWSVRQRSNIVPNELPHLLGQLINGHADAADALRSHGLRVTVEEDTDQGDDGPDDLLVPR